MQIQLLDVKRYVMKSLRVESINIGSPTVWMRITDGPNKRLNRKFRKGL